MRCRGSSCQRQPATVRHRDTGAQYECWGRAACCGPSQRLQQFACASSACAWNQQMRCRVSQCCRDLVAWRATLPGAIVCSTRTQHRGCISPATSIRICRTTTRTQWSAMSLRRWSARGYCRPTHPGRTSATRAAAAPTWVCLRYRRCVVRAPRPHCSSRRLQAFLLALRLSVASVATTRTLCVVR